MKKILAISLFIIFIITGIYCQNLTIGLLNGPSCIPVVELMEEQSKIQNSMYEFEKFSDPTALIPKLIKKEIDVGFLPLNAAVKVFNSSNHAVLCCAITGEGNLSLITKDDSIKSLNDLKEKTVNIAGQGATPEYLFKYVLKQNNLIIDSKKGVTLDYSIPTNQIAGELISDKIQYAVLPEPFVTIARLNSKQELQIIDLQKEYLKLNPESSNYTLTVMVVSKKAAQNNPNLINEFLDNYEKSFMWTISNPKDAGILSEKHNLGLKANIVEKSIPKANYTYVKASLPQTKQKCEQLLNIFMEFEPSSIGGKLPSEDFYYK